MELVVFLAYVLPSQSDLIFIGNSVTVREWSLGTVPIYLTVIYSTYVYGFDNIHIRLYLRH